MINAVLVGVGGFAGVIFRYSLGWIIHRKAPEATFPYGTLVVNLIGCLFIGVIAGLIESRNLFSPELRRFALIGLLGGFTTYSTFAYETFSMILNAEYLRAFSNVSIHVVLGIIFVWAGYSISISR